MGLKKRTKILIICGIILDVFMCMSLFVLYGPWSYFRNFWITSAMTSMNHQYLAHWFYSNNTINEVMEDNKVIESGEDSDPSLIDKHEETNLDEYDKQILTKDKDNSLYKVINISGKSYKGFLVVVYDSSKINLVSAKGMGTIGERLNVIAEENKAKIAINASGFLDPNERGNGGQPTGSIVQDGKLIWSSSRPEVGGGVVGFNYNNKLILTKDNMKTAMSIYNLKDAIEFGPFLIVNGKPSFIRGNGGWGIAPRTAIAQRKDGIVLFLIIDGRKPGYSLGADMVDLTEILTKYKAYNAANLDGGASTGLIINNKIINHPVAYTDTGLRRTPNAWIIK